MNNIIKIDDFFYCDLPGNIAFRTGYKYDSSYINFYTDNINLLKYNIYRLERDYNNNNFTKGENYYTFEYVADVEAEIGKQFLIANREGYVTYKDDIDVCPFYYMFELTTLSDVAKFKMLTDL